MTSRDWEQADGGALAMLLGTGKGGGRVAVLLNRTAEEIDFSLPERAGYDWSSTRDCCTRVGPRAVAIVSEAALETAGAST